MGTNEESDADKEKEAHADNDDDDECGTEFVGEQVLTAFKARLPKGDVPTIDDILKLFYVSALAEDEDMVPMNIASLAEECATVDVEATIKALVKKHGALKASELLVACEQNDDQESGEEEDDEEEMCEDDADVAEDKAAHISVGKSES